MIATADAGPGARDALGRVVQAAGLDVAADHSFAG